MGITNNLCLFIYLFNFITGLLIILKYLDTLNTLSIILFLKLLVFKVLKK